jgi:hypothetical protein
MTYDAFNLKKGDIDKYMELMGLNQCCLCKSEHSYAPSYDDDYNIIFMHADFSTYDKDKDTFELVSNSFYVPITCTNCGNAILLAPLPVVRKLNESEE